MMFNLQLLVTLKACDLKYYRTTEFQQLKTTAETLKTSVEGRTVQLHSFNKNRQELKNIVTRQLTSAESNMLNILTSY